MSGIVLSASVRQNLLSLQSTASLLATTQNHLATGKKVNTALDNPTNFFTAQGLNNRASDISQSARRHRQRRAGAAGRQHRHHLAAEAGRQRQVDRQPGAAEPDRLHDQIQRDVGDAITGASAANLLAAQSNTDHRQRHQHRRHHGNGRHHRLPRRCRAPRAASTNDLASAISATDTLVVNGVTFTFTAGTTIDRHAASVSATP